MSSSWVRSLLLGISVALIGALWWLLIRTPVLPDFPLFTVFVAGPTLQTVIALGALRRSQSPVGQVLSAGAAYWVGASVGWVIGWNIADVVASDRGLTLSDGALAWSWTLAAMFTAAIAAVTGSVHLWRART
jgi:hypothetical protein